MADKKQQVTPNNKVAESGTDWAECYKNLEITN